MARNYRLKVFVATQYGRKVAAETLQEEFLETGRMNESEIFERAELEAPEKVVDATHPFALEISKNLMNFCLTCKIPYIRYERPEEPITGENIYFVNVQFMLND